MTEVILENQGEIDKFIGDSVMARFGVLAELPNAPQAAVTAALAMFRELVALQARWLADGRDGFAIRIGIATGPVLAGNIGSERRQEFTVMGTTVNLASRLENLNKELGTSLLVDENTYAAVAGMVAATPRDNIRIRGLDEPINVYEIHGLVEQAAQPAQAAQQAKIISFSSKLAAARHATAPGGGVSERGGSPGTESGRGGAGGGPGHGLSAGSRGQAGSGAAPGGTAGPQPARATKDAADDHLSLPDLLPTGDSSS